MAQRLSLDVAFDGEMGPHILASAKNFKTGSRGFYGHGKIDLDGKRYQVICNVIEVGSKDRPADSE
jgi:hypothetical protein